MGTLHLTYLSNLRKLDLKNEIVLFIVRKNLGIENQDLIHVPELSPSLELFEKVKRWKKEDFRENEFNFLKKTGEYPDWWPLYEIAFEKEIRERKDMKKYLKAVEKRLKEGKDVYLVCFCKSVEKCHRGILGKYFAEKGYEVIFE